MKKPCTLLGHKLSATNFPECFHSCSSAVAMSPIPLNQVKDLLITGSYARAWNLGQTVLQAKKNKKNPIDAILGVEKNGQLLTVGKV